MTSKGFDPAEEYQSQIPALQLLVAMGYRPLSQDEVVRLRSGRLRNVVLDEVLAEQLLKINRFTHRGKEYAFDLEDAHEAIQRLKPTPERLKGLRATNQDVYNSLVLGTTITKTIEGDSKSYSFRYVDWDEPANNVFHVTAEMAVERTGSTETRRCDIACFVNGIPFVVIENKRPTEDLKKAMGQLIKYQGESNIPQLFHFAQLLVSMNRKDALYATVGTPKRFWQRWRDETPDEVALSSLAARGLKEAEADTLADAIAPAHEAAEGNGTVDELGNELGDLVNKPMGLAEEKLVFSGPMTSAQGFFRKLAAAGEREVTEQDRALHALCRPERLLDVVRRFTVFEGGERKIARHPQYFGIHAALDRVKTHEASGKRKGGVIWHTQGSGKSLTMVMLGRALVLDKEIENPRLIIVTDRDDLDRQIKGTFKSCDMEPVRATTGANLGSLIRAKTPLITTIINKFHRLTKGEDLVDPDPNVFVLVDESHRTQSGDHGGFGQFALRMRRILPNACYIGFTGTPLLKKEKNTLATFGGLIHKYAIDEAIEDELVVPLLYEGRLVEQEVTGGAVDKWFEKISQKLTDAQKADLKKKYSRMDALGQTEQAVRAKAFDISEHYRQHWQGTGFKAQLVAPSKVAAVRFKEILDEIGHVTSEIIISPPDENEGADEVDRASKEKVQAFWDAMMARFNKSEEAYNRDIINAFKSGDDPEILIVVSKLLTGFDAPRNTVLYVCKPLRDHTLLQAIARVNRLYEDEEKGQEKQFGFIIDYEGLLGELDKALTTYSAFEGYDPEDVRGVVEDVREEIRKLPSLHEHLWDHFKTIPNKQDMEQFEQLLADDAKREEFYARLKAFGRCLHISISSDKVLDVLDERTLETMKRDLKHFAELRRSVQVRYQEVVDMKEYEPKIRKLLDDHVTAAPAETIIQPVNINDPDSLNKVIEETGVAAASKADRIASATRRAITEKMEQDPAFYKRFSEMLEQTIRDYRKKRLSEKEYLRNVVEMAQKVARKEHDAGMPASLKGDEDAQAFYGVVNEALGTANSSNGSTLNSEGVADIARAVLGIIKERHIVDVWSNDIACSSIQNAIDDYFFDVVRDEKGVTLAPEQLDDLQQKIMDLARARFPG